MSKFIRVSGGDIEPAENVIKLEQLTSNRKPTFDMNNTDLDNLIAQTHVCQIELVHLIKTEDRIDNLKEQLSNELRTYTRNVAKEFMQDILDPFCESVTKFLEKHPEYIVKGLTMNSEVESGKSVALREIKHVLMEMMGN